jgi:hypothetical protein
MNRIGPIFLISIGLILLVGIVGFLLISNAIENPGFAPLPQELGDLSLTRYSTGRAAADEVIRLHENSFLVTSASVGSYGRNQVTIWVTGSPAIFLAGRMVADMEEKIRNVPSPFMPVSDRKDGNRIIYELDGIGQRHFYFQSGNLVVWLAAYPDIAEAVLIDALNFYP